MVIGLAALKVLNKESTGHPPANRKAEAATLVCAAIAVSVLALAVHVRLLPLDQVFVDGEVLPLGADSSYHLRRIALAAADLRGPSHLDPLLNWPRGALSMWSPGFDWLAALVAVALGARGDAQRIAEIAAILPVALGTAAVAASMLFVQRLDPRREARWAALAAGLFVALLSQSIAIAQVGFIDHHVTEVLFTALLATWTAARTTAHRSMRGDVAFEIAGAVLCAGAVWVQTVGVVYVGVAAAALVLSALFEPRAPGPRSLWGSGGPALVAGGFILAALAVPSVREHARPLSYAWPSYLQPLLLVFGGVAIIAPSALRRRVMALTVAVIAPSLLALIPAVRRAVTSSFSEYLLSGDAWLAGIDEIQPLLSGGALRELGAFWRVDAMFGWSGWLGPLLLPAGVAVAWRQSRRAGMCLGVWTIALCALSLAQNRWSRALTVPFAACAGLALVAGFARVVALWPRKPAAAAPALALVASAVLLLLPSPAYMLLPSPARSGTDLFDAAIFLRVGEGAERSGVLAKWDHGFDLLALSGRPVLSSGFGPFSGRDGFDAERAAWSGSASSLWSLLDERRIGFVVAGTEAFARVKAADGSGPFIDQGGVMVLHGPYFLDVPLGVMMLGGSGIPELGVPHLDALCPRFVGAQFAAGLAFPLPRIWAFERVTGAVLRGEAEPRARVQARVTMTHRAGSVDYVAWSDADDNGRFAIRAPLWTSMASPALSTGAAFAVSVVGGEPVLVEVPEAAVREGRAIDVPRR